MKNIYILSVLLLILLMASCSDWLDVDPRTQIEAKKLFKTEDGFKAAHTGSYLLLTNQSLYGRNANMFLPEALARHWSLNILSQLSGEVETLNEMSKYEYKHAKVESFIADMWVKYYNVIAQSNNILENLETTKANFKYNNDKLIEGEILGLRAFLHLELLRYFGSIPGQGDVGIPYVTKMTKEIDALSSKPFDEVIALIEADLNKAELILKEVDPLVKYSVKDLNPGGSGGDNLDEWQTKRQGRFNYFAVLGTKARLYNWIGDKENAVKYAGMVIDAKNKDNSAKFPLIVKSTLTDQVLYAEHLFGLHNPKLVTALEKTFSTQDPILSQTETLVKVAYEANAHPGDIRNSNSYFWENTQYGTTVIKGVFQFKKYIGTSQMRSITRIPLLRVAELYLILIENASFDVAQLNFIHFAKERSLDILKIEAELTDESKILPLLEKEYRKEFFGEGQMFFFYKKHDYKSFSWPILANIPPGVYVIPKPEGQLQFE